MCLQLQILTNFSQKDLPTRAHFHFIGCVVVIFIFALSPSNVVVIMLINVKMPTIVGILHLLAG